MFTINATSPKWKKTLKFGRATRDKVVLVHLQTKKTIVILIKHFGVQKWDVELL
jgi:hypothetical protein